jgi:hypothetical protein
VATANLTQRDTDQRAAIYRRLLHDTILLRTPTSIGERGASFMYAASNSVVRNRPPAVQFHDAAIEFRDQMRACLSASGPASIMPKDESLEAILAAVAQLRKSHRYSTVLFEGYVADAVREQSALVETLAARLEADGLTVLRPAGAVADTWNNKTRFVDHVRRTLGVEATAPGEVVPVAPVETVTRVAENYLRATGRALLKLTGMGGFGNLIVFQQDVDTGELHDKIARFIDRRPDVDEVRIEEWVPWNQSVCCSFFIDEHARATPMEICDQVLSTRTSGFVGGCSLVNLSSADREMIVEWLRPFMQMVADDGMRGFLAVDLIISDPRGRPGELLLPQSGQAVRLVEANMRINGHNQERWAVAQLAAAHGRGLDDIQHYKAGLNVIGFPDRSAVLAGMAGALDGLARPLTAEFVAGEIYYIVTESYGEAHAHRHDSVLMVGEAVTADRFRAAAEELRRVGLLKA